MRRRILIVAVVLLAVAPRAGVADGAWQTFLRPLVYTDLLVRGDTVWCATLEAGLVRFLADDDRFDSLVREPGGLAGNSLAAIAFDRSHRLWVGTYGRGASRLDPDGSWRLLNAFDGLPSDTVNVVEAAGDTMWLGTTRGLALWNGREIAGVLPDGSSPSPFASDRITGVALIGDTVWVSTEAGIYRSFLSGGLTAWTPINTGLPVLRRVDALACDGAALVALSNLVTYRRDPATDQWIVSGGIGAVRRLADDAGVITAAASLGIYSWNGTGWTQVNGTLRSTGVARSNFAVGVGANGSIYAATSLGLYDLTAGTSHFPPGPPGNNVLNVDVERSRLYCNTFSDGVGRYDGADWTLWLPRGIDRSDTSFRDPRFVFALAVDRLGRKWFGQWAPLRSPFPCDPDTGLIEVLDDSVDPPHFTHVLVQDGLDPARHSFARTSAVDTSGGMWLGFGSPCAEDPSYVAIGIDHYDSTGTFDRNYRPDNTARMNGSDVRAIEVDHLRRVWVGYKGQGIDTFERPAPGADITITPIVGAATLDVRGLAAHGDSVWVYTTSDLRRYRSGSLTDAPVTYTFPAGPAESATRPLEVAPDGTVWLGSGTGVRCYRTDGTTQDFTTSNSPLADNEVRAIRVDPATGVVWFGTAGGINRYDPGFTVAPLVVPRIEVNAYPNPARLTGLGIRLRIGGNVARFEGTIHDASGRILRRFTAGNGEVFWDGRGRSGQIVRPGLYFVRVEAAGRIGVARFVLLR